MSFIKALCILFAITAISSNCAEPLKMSLGKSSMVHNHDGKMDPSEWRHGMEIYGAVSMATGELALRDVSFFLARDDKYLHLAVRSELFRWSDNIKLTPEDTVEITIIPPGGTPVSAKLNSQEQGSVPPGSLKGGKIADKAWVLELSIPWAAFNMASPIMDKPWKIQMARNWCNPKEISVLDPSGFAEIIFDDSVPFVSANVGATEPTHGKAPKLIWKVENSLTIPAEVRCVADIQWVGNPELINSQVSIAAGKSHQFELIPTGSNTDSRTMKYLLTCNGKTLLSRQLQWSDNGLRWIDPNPHIGRGFGIYPTLKVAKARIYCTKDSKLDDYASVEFLITDSTGKVLSSQSAPRGKFGFHAQWSIAELPHGDYKLVTKIKLKDGNTIKMVGAFEYREFPWQNNTIGMERVIVPPFQPMQTDKQNNTIMATLTGYQLGDGLLSKIFAEKQNILASPVQLFINGQELKAGSVVFGEISADRVTAKNTFTTSNITINANYDFDYDGMILTNLNFIPKGKCQIQSMYLDIPVKEAYASLLHSVSAQLRRNPAGYIPKGIGVVWDSIRNAPSNYRPYIWIGELSKGIAWFCESEKNWSLDPGKPMAEIIRKDGTVTMRIYMVNNPCFRDKPFSIEMGFQATPVKPMMPNFRKYSTVAVDGWIADNSIPTGMILDARMWAGSASEKLASAASVYPWNSDYSFVNYLKNSGPVSDEEVKKVVQEYIEKNIPAKQHKVYARMMGHAVRNLTRNASYVIPYFNPRAGAKTWAEFATFQDEWRNDAFRTGNEGWYFQNPVKSYRDFMMPHLREIVRNGADGIYFDNTFDSVNEDETMGPVVEYALGKYKRHHTFLEMRRLIKRTATMLYLENKMIEDRPYLVLHMTNAAIIPMLSFGAFALDWEAYYGNKDYQERFTEGYILSESTGKQSGLVPQVLIDASGDVNHLQKTALALMLPYDLLNVFLGHAGPRKDFRRAINIIRRFGYGDPGVNVYPCYDKANPLKISDGNIKAAILIHKNCALLMAGDFGNGGAVDIDLSGLGFTDCYALDAETGKELGKGSRISVTFEKHYYKLIVIGDGADAALKALSKSNPEIAKNKSLTNGTAVGQCIFTWKPANGKMTQHFDGKVAGEHFVLKEALAAFSFAAWVKPAANSNGTIISRPGWHTFLSYNALQQQFNFIYYNENGKYYDLARYSEKFPAEHWYFVVVTANPVNGETTLYVNGKPITMSKFSGSLRKYTDVYIGSTTDKTGFFSGEIALIEIYNAPLPLTKIQELYQQYSNKLNNGGE